MLTSRWGSVTQHAEQGCKKHACLALSKSNKVLGNEILRVLMILPNVAKWCLTGDLHSRVACAQPKFLLMFCIFPISVYIMCSGGDCR